jgi:hypothetical protein
LLRFAERKNRNLLEVARALMFTMNVPKPYFIGVMQFFVQPISSIVCP